MPTLANIVDHPLPTQKTGFLYIFTPKHHGADKGASCWLPELPLEREFSIFDAADQHEIADDAGNLYGLSRSEEGGLHYLGIWFEQLAEFPFQEPGAKWHGYPSYPLKDVGPENRRGDKCKPAKEVFKKMYRAILISAQERKRLSKGDHV